MISISTPRRRGRGVLLLSALLCGFLAPALHPALAQEDTAGFSGIVLDPEGKPAEGYQLVFRDDAGQEHVAPPSDDLGRYSIDLVPGSYQLVAAIAPDGSRMDVPSLPALPVEWGARRLDIRIGSAEPPAKGKATKKSESKSASKPVKTKAASGVPWVQIGAATGTVLILALAVWDTGDAEKTASPFVPPPGR
jgi:hypothetical protein